MGFCDPANQGGLPIFAYVAAEKEESIAINMLLRSRKLRIIGRTEFRREADPNNSPPPTINERCHGTPLELAAGECCADVEDGSSGSLSLSTLSVEDSDVDII